MAITAIEQRYGSLSTASYPSGYDSTKLNLGSLMCQKSGAGAVDNWCGPFPVSVASPMDYSAGAQPGLFPSVISWSSTIDWVFLVDGAAPSGDRRINLFYYDRSTNAFTQRGYITVQTVSGSGNHTVTGFKMTYDTYTTGTAAVSGTAVTGTSTVWQTSRLAVGSRIGFGTSIPSSVVTWYGISAIGGDTSITLSGSAGTIGDGPYVIEDLRAVIQTTSSSANYGSLLVVKGLSYSIFTTGGTTVGMGTTTDNIRAGYWLQDAAVPLNLNQNPIGLGLQPKDSWTQQFCWSIDVSTTVLTLYKYDIRAALTLTGGRSTDAFLFKTSTFTITTTTPSSNNNGVYAITNHDSGSGIGRVYFTDLTKIYRTKNVTAITIGDTGYIDGTGIVENPPSTASTYALSNLLGAITYDSVTDSFVVLPTVAGTPFRSYVTQYKKEGTSFDRVFLTDARQIETRYNGTLITPTPSYLSRALTCCVANGLLYIVGVGTTLVTNFVYALPMGADWGYTNVINQVIITPVISTPNCSSFVRVYYNCDRIVGSYNLGIPAEPLQISYRVSGITDNSGVWALLDDYGDLSNVPPSSSIQFKYEFRTIGTTCVPARVLSTTVLYNDLSTDSHFQPSVGLSNISSKQFAWRFSTAFGTTVPALRIKLYDSVTGSLLVDDNTVSLKGTWEKSTNGGSSWASWNNTDKGNDTTYLRFTPATLGDNTKVRAFLILN